MPWLNDLVMIEPDDQNAEGVGVLHVTDAIATTIDPFHFAFALLLFQIEGMYSNESSSLSLLWDIANRQHVSTQLKGQHLG